MTKREKFSLILFTSINFLTVIAVLIGCIHLQTTETKTEVIATISEKQYEEDGYKTVPHYNPATGSTTYSSVHYPEKYLVTITYKDISETCDAKTLYEQFNQGDDICMILSQSFYKNGNLASQKLEFPE